jgi:glycosyltransferase involved in cell wall biosynthesis
LANALYGFLSGARRPFAVEVVADPFDMMSPGAMRHPLRPVFRHHYTTYQRKLCQLARAVKYVTRSALQRRYPADRSASVHAISDVYLPDAAYRTGARPIGNGPLRLIFVGMLEQLYKAPDVLIRAVAQVIRQGTPLHLKILGDGGCRVFLEDLARQTGIAGAVQFLGGCDRQAIQEAFDDSDLFVLPSRQEGLPRAMLEAMAHGLPCVGTEVGGIPELLERDFLVQPNRVDELASRLMTLAENRTLLATAGQRNLSVAREYRLEVRTALETAFARDVRRLCR